jgi:DNA-binding CsgD family transcriptional regulator
LSKRQSELVGLLTQGLKNKEIASALGISEGTVKAYLTTLYEKVGARDRFELALFGLKNLGGRRENSNAGGTIRSLVARRGGVRRLEA